MENIHNLGVDPVEGTPKIEPKSFKKIIEMLDDPKVGEEVYDELEKAGNVPEDIKVVPAESKRLKELREKKTDQPLKPVSTSQFMDSWQREQDQ